MNNNINKVQQNINTNRSRYNLYVFLICLTVATSIWLLIKLSKDYEVTVKVVLEYENVPKDKFISKADTMILLTMKVNGLRLLTKRLPEKEFMVININDFSFRKDEKNHFKGTVGLDKYISELMKRKFHYALSYERVVPEKLSIEMDYAYSKKVPVQVPFSYTLEKQYLLYKDIEISPDSVVLYGPKSKLDKINIIQTDSIILHNLKENTEIFSKFKTDGDFNYHISHKSVKVVFYVEKFTEMEINLPIFLFKNLQSQIKIFPENIRLILMVAIKDYQNITPDLFSVVPDTSDMNNRTSLPLKLEKFPPNVKLNKMIPQEVEFIRIK